MFYPKKGQMVRLTGKFGTPSQHNAVWIASKPDYCNWPFAMIHRLSDPDCWIEVPTRCIVPTSPLEMLALQAPEKSLSADTVGGTKT